MDPRQLLIREWQTVEDLIAAAARRRKLQEAEAEELSSVVKVKLFENDCAVIRNFRGESKLSTYLHVLVDRAAVDIRARRTGKWHTSAAAKRLGPVAIELEQLMYRSGLTVEEAVAVIRRKRSVLTLDELNSIAGHIPHRIARYNREMPLEVVEDSLCGDDEADTLVIAEERRTTWERAAAIIRSELQNAEDEDRLVFQMRFEAGLRIADIARMLGVDPAPLYRRHAELLCHLKDTMESEGITAKEVADLFGHISEEFDFGVRKPELRPSQTAKGIGIRTEKQR